MIAGRLVTVRLHKSAREGQVQGIIYGRTGIADVKMRLPLSAVKPMSSRLKAWERTAQSWSSSRVSHVCPHQPKAAAGDSCRAISASKKAYPVQEALPLEL